MKKWLLIALVAVLALGLLGCAEKRVGPGPEQQVAKPAETPVEKKPETVTEKAPVVAKPAEVVSAVNELAELQAKVKDVYFAFDKYDLNDQAKASLKELADLLSKNKYKVVIEGHCDERGTREYNLALGDKRANAAKQYLVTLGITSARIDVVSYGKEKPQCTAGTEECWAKNRRDHFVLGEAGK